MSLPRTEWRAELPCTLDAIEEFCIKFRAWRAESCARVSLFPAELLLREALTNSVVHGCLEDPAKHVWCVLRAKTDRLVISIRDEGEGFDWRAGWHKTADISRPDGRGMEILRKYASSVRFNPKGNAVTLITRF